MMYPRVMIALRLIKTLMMNGMCAVISVIGAR